jgi:hypothetical protein
VALPTAGYAITKTDLDNRMGSAVVALRDAFIAIVALKAELDDSTILPTATMTGSAPTGLAYSSADDTMIRAAFTDLAKLWDISRNVATQSTTNDFWFNAKHLCGLNLH